MKKRTDASSTSIAQAVRRVLPVVFVFLVAASSHGVAASGLDVIRGVPNEVVVNGPIIFSNVTGTCTPFACMYDDTVGADVWRTDPDGTNTVNLTNHPGSDRDARSSPDGSVIAFTSNRNGNDDLFVMDVDGQNPRQLTSDPANEQSPSWSPDGRHIAYIREARRTEDVIVMDADGSGQRRVASFGSIWGLNWSPDGKWLALVNRTRGRNGWGAGNDDIYVVRPDGTGIRKVVATRRFDEGWPAWAPRSHTIAFQRTAECEGNDEFSVCDLNVWTIRVDGSRLKQLTESPHAEAAPTWAPDGRKIAYSSDEDDPGGGDVFVMNRDGSDQARVLAKPESFDVPHDWLRRQE